MNSNSSCDNSNSACNTVPDLPSKKGIKLGNAVEIEQLPYKFQYSFDKLEDAEITLDPSCPADKKAMGFAYNVPEPGTFHITLCNVKNNTGRAPERIEMECVRH